MAEPIEMPFEALTRVSPGNHVWDDEGPASRRMFMWLSGLSISC